MCTTKKLERAKAAGFFAAVEAHAATPNDEQERGDWLSSVVTQRIMQLYTHDGQVPADGRRLPDPNEPEPAPRANEQVILTQFVERGLSLPIQPFLREVLSYFRAQLHHLTPNGVAHLLCFVTLCEGFLGIPPNWVLFKHIFYAKPQTVEKNVMQICGGLGIQVKSSGYFDMKWLDTVKNWQSTWFYCVEPSTVAGPAALPPYTNSAAKWHSLWSFKLTKGEQDEAKILMAQIGALSDRGLTSNDLVATWVSWRIQPLQARVRGMWL